MLKNGDRVLAQPRAESVARAIGVVACSRLTEGAILIPYGRSDAIEIVLQLQKEKTFPTVADVPIFLAVGKTRSVLETSLRIKLGFADKSSKIVLTNYKTFCSQVVQPMIGYSKRIAPEGIYHDEDQISVIVEGLVKQRLTPELKDKVTSISFKPHSV